MLDPYLVLGVGKYDDDQTVKKAYRKLSKQYHPDNNLNNPNKEAAEETFKKIQQAYEQIMHERSLGIGGPNDVRRNQNEKAANSNSSTAWDSVRRASWNHADSTSQNSGPQYNGSSWNGDSGYSQSDSSNSNTGTSYSYGNNGYYSGNADNQAGSYGNPYSRSDSGNSYNQGYGSGYNNANGRTGYYSGNYSYTGNQRNDSGNYGYNGNQGYNSGNYSYTGNQGYNSGYGFNYSQNVYEDDTDSMLGNVAKMLNSRKFYEAWDILNSMQTRNDVWYYYSAIANMGLGNSITALSHARKAKEMQPGRPEYDELINGIQSGAISYRGRSEMFVPQKGNASNTCLKIGIAMIFMNLFCGGGGIAIPLCIGC